MPDHHPPHVYLDSTWYFVTASIHNRQHLLRSIGHKDFVRDQLKALVVEFQVQLAAGAILGNHYHLLGKSHVGQDLARLFSRWHGRTAFELNRRDGKRGRQVWHTYWDTCIRTEADDWTRFNYIHYNPVKHSYVGRTEDWLFSSYRYYLEHKGNDGLMDSFERYPIVDFTDQGDDF
jgi:putative transposase